MPDETDIAFEIDESSSIPIYQQLREQLFAWIADRSTGTRLPSGRELAARTGLNRRTIRKALGWFVEEGMIERRVKRGTVVVDRSRWRSGGGDVEPHPFLVDGAMNGGAVPKTIRFALFENLPHQKRVWKRIVADFNRRFAPRELDPIWLDHRVASAEDYMDFAKAEDIDVVMLTEALATEFIARGRLLELPRAIADSFATSNHHLRGLQVAVPRLFDYVNPLHFSLNCVTLNMNLTGGEEPPPSCSGAAMRAFLIKVAAKLPDDALLTSAPWGLAGLLGAPERADDRESVQAYVTAMFERMTRFRQIAGKLRWEETSHERVNADFQTGRVAAYVGSPTLLFPILRTCDFPWKVIPLVPRRREIHTSGISAVGVTASTGDRHAAFDVVRHLISAEVQSQMGLIPLNFAPCREANSTILKSLDIPPETFERATSRIAGDHSRSGRTRNLAISLNIDLLKKVVEGECSARSAVTAALARLEKQLPLGRE